MILVGQFDSPFVRRVAITLQLYGMKVTRNPISVFGDATQMALINPLMRIPSLVLDDGDVLVDSAAILDYLDELVGPSRALAPRSGLARRHILKVMAVATGAVDKAGATVYERHFHPSTVNKEWVTRLKGQLKGGLVWLEENLKGDWFFDGTLSHADISAAVLIGYLRLRLSEMLTGRAYPRLEGLSQRCEAMDAFIVSRPNPYELMPPRPQRQ